MTVIIDTHDCYHSYITVIIDTPDCIIIIIIIKQLHGDATYVSQK